MADNVDITPGVGATVAADDVGGALYQRMKLAFGTDGSATDVSSANPFPVSVGATYTTVPDNQTAGFAVRAIGQDLWACSFAAVIAAGIDSTYWTERTVGTGVGRSQASSNLLITTGTSTNAEYLARSNVAWRSSMRLRYQTVLSQRIANQNFAIILADKIGEGLSCTINSATSITVSIPSHSFTSLNVGQSMFVGGITGAAGVPGRYAIASVVAGTSVTFTVAGWPASGSCTLDLFGWSNVRCLYTSTTATNVAFDSQRFGWNSGDTTATINTTASPGHLGQILMDGRDIYYADQLVASATTPNVTTRASRHVNIPDDNLDLYVYLWSYNGTSAPASTTTWTVGFVSVERMANMPVFIEGNRSQGTAAPAPVQVTGTAAVSLATNTPTLAAGTNLAADFGIQARANATGAGTPYFLSSLGTTAATSIKAGAGRVLAISLSNTSAALRSVKFFNTLVGSITMGTTAAIYEIDIPAGGVSPPISLDCGIGHSAAICFAVTTTKGLTDNTGAGAAGDVTGVVVYA